MKKKEKDTIPLAAIGRLIVPAKRLAVSYYCLTGKPLGITGEVGEYEVARRLRLRLTRAREPGVDAIDPESGHRYQIKARVIPRHKRTNSQRIGRIRRDHPCDAVLLVLMNELLEPTGIWQAKWSSVMAAIERPGSKSRNQRGQLSVSKFKQISTPRWGSAVPK